jgi:hypothetical protein
MAYWSTKIAIDRTEPQGCIGSTPAYPGGLEEGRDGRALLILKNNPCTVDSLLVCWLRRWFVQANASIM